MRVKARAVILIDGRLIVAEQLRRGRNELSLPGGRVNNRESVIEALKREVAEETGLQVTPGRLLYVVRPPILDQIASDAASGWRGNPRWLGNLGRPTANRKVEPV